MEDWDDYVIVDFEEDTFSGESDQLESDFDEISENSDIDLGFGMSQGYEGMDINQLSVDFSKISISRKHKEEVTIQDVVKEHVLPFLPAKTLCRFRIVCKEWNNRITHPFLIHSQSHSFKDISGFFCQAPDCDPFFISFDPFAYGIPSPTLSFLPDSVTVRASSNGMLCCKSFCIGDNSYYICNPVNREWKLLPQSKFYHGPNSALALAFEPSTFNFKASFQLVCTFSLPDSPVVCFEIYSSRSNSWRIAESMCWEEDALELKGDGFVLKGVAFWETWTGAILTFSLIDEHYGLMTHPDPAIQGSHGVLTEMNGELCYILPHEEGDELTLDVYGGWNMSLKRKIPLHPKVFGGKMEHLRVLSCVNDDVLMLLLGSRGCAYHLKEGKLEFISNAMNRSGTECVKYLPYVNSLVSVGHGLVESDE